MDPDNKSEWKYFFTLEKSPSSDESQFHKSLERVDIAASRHAARSRDRSLESSSFYGTRNRDDVPMPDPYKGATRETILDGLPDSYRSLTQLQRGTNPIMDNRCSVTRPQTVSCRVSPPSNQHIAIASTKSERAFIRRRNKSQLCPPMSPSVTPLMLQIMVVWSQWNARYGEICSGPVM
ncbi:ERC protein 2 [Trichonephila clavipes]|uniref:ERC protein 2 n=1 Tax=Trichonephila clavipes TaxID=2585209 RepID=A0A8X6SDC7_TRICX|nr:ERC protein 2 [Trichonephila clavipes]